MSARPVPCFERPAVFLVNAIGDQIIALPAIRALTTIFPGGLQLLLGQGMQSFFYRELPVSEPVWVCWYDYGDKSIDVDRIAPLTQPSDLFINLSTWTSPSVLELARRMKATWTVGYYKMFDDVVYSEASTHMFDRLFSIPRHLRPDLRFEDFASGPAFAPGALKT